MSEDEYDAYNDFADLTEEDFARLEASYRNEGLPESSQNRGTHSGPLISIEIEGAPAEIGSLVQERTLTLADLISLAEQAQDENLAETGSPAQKYRRRGTLTVTDLVSLAWCEVQFDYGLRQKRSRKLADRLPSFKLDSGKEIVVQQDIAARNDKTTKRGRLIHKELELELQPVEIKVVTTSDEEYWAFRLMNFLSSLVALKADGCVREVPVFGLVNDALVVGIVDELLVKEPETGSKRASDSPLPSPKRTCRSPSPTETTSTAPAYTPPPQQTIRVIDTKTRRTDSLPSDEDAEPARLQVMLYHRLITGLLEASAPFDYPSLWTRLALRPSEPFSGGFLRQTAAVLGSDSPPTCLDDVVRLLRSTVTELGLPALDSTVEIIYRSQNKYSDRRRKGKGKSPHTPATREDEDIAKAIEISLTDAFEAELATALKESAAAAQLGAVDETSIQGPSNRPLAAGCSTAVLNDERADGRQCILNESAAPDDNFQPAVQVSENGEIIGTKQFAMDDMLLETYLVSALQWWNGERKARGVSERQTGRCHSCEYRNDCEWREQKAAEATLRYRSSKGAA